MNEDNQDVEKTAFNCAHKMLIGDALFTVIVTTTVFVSHSCSSFYLITVRGSVRRRSRSRSRSDAYFIALGLVKQNESCNIRAVECSVIVKMGLS